MRHKKVWVIGASKGIGAALVKQLDAAGVDLAITARKIEPLKELSSNCQSNPVILDFDVCDIDAFHQNFERLVSLWHEIDSIIFMPAIYERMALDQLDLKSVERHLDVNLMSVFNCIHTVLPQLKKQSYGQLVLCSSVAGLVGLPGGQPYSATKAAVTNIAQSLKCENPNLDIKVIHPGFVKTRLTEKNDFTMPMLMLPEQAAANIVKGLKSKAFEISFPKRFVWGLKLLSLMPYRLYFSLLGLKKDKKN